MTAPQVTPAQTAGPFLHIGMQWPPDGPNAVADDHPDAVVLTGRIVDGAGEPVADALVETWQADGAGRFASDEDPRGRAEGFRGWARSATDDDGRWRIVTVKPGPVPGPGGSTQAPHIDCTVHARGLLRHLFTRIYFADEPVANGGDPVLSTLAADRRATLLAAATDDGYELDIRLQGDRATVFFDA